MKEERSGICLDNVRIGHEILSITYDVQESEAYACGKADDQNEKYVLCIVLLRS